MNSIEFLDVYYTFWDNPLKINTYLLLICVIEVFPRAYCIEFNWYQVSFFISYISTASVYFYLFLALTCPQAAIMK